MHVPNSMNATKAAMPQLKKTNLNLLVCTCLVLVFGCGESLSVKFRFNEVEWVKQERLNLEDGEHFSNSYRKEIGKRPDGLVWYA